MNMGIFSKNKQGNNYEEGHNENLFRDEDDFLLLPDGEITPWTKRKNKIVAPHALTPDEVLHNNPEEIQMNRESHPKPESVYQKMKQQEQISAEKGFDDNYVPSWTKSEIPAEKAQPTNKEETINIPVVQPKKQIQRAPTSDFLERCKIAVNLATGVTDRSDLGKPVIEQDVKEEIVSDVESENIKGKEPEKINADEILRKLRGESAPVTINSEASSTEENTEVREEKDQPVIEEIKVYSQIETDNETKTEAEVKDDIIDEESDVELENESEHRRIDVEVEVIPTDSPSNIMQTDESDIKIYDKAESSEIAGQVEEFSAENEKTIMFDHLEDIIASKADMQFEDSYDDDDDDEYDEYDEEKVPYYETVDHELDGIDDYKDLNDAARLRVDIMTEASKRMVHTVFSAIATLLIILVSSPLGNIFGEKAVAVINLILLVAVMIVNYEVFYDIKNLFKGKPSFDSCAVIASAVTLVQSVICNFVGDGKYANITAAATLLLTINALVRRLKSSRILKGLERIATSEEKCAVISAERNAGNTIASGAVNGEALVLCGKNTINITDYIKNSSYKSPFDLKVNILIIVGLLVAAFVGAVGAFLVNMFLGLTLAALTLCLAYPASAAFICELPMYLAQKRAARYGAMIAGYKGAYNLNLANTVAVKTSDLFPKGSVTLYNMKPLGNIDIGQSLVEAAAVAIAAKSPLAGILSDIIGDISEKEMPKIDGVQYEDKMGISGWIGEKTILIGNRNLMQGHNIQVPPLSIDKKILQAGYFPVYIATDGVPCLLFVVKYETDPHVTLELGRLCSTGMTVVVDPEDPNPTDMMLCNYFGLPNDAVKVMNHNGRTTYEKVSSHAESSTANAGFSKTICGFFSAVTSAIKLPGTYMALAVMAIIAAVLGVTTLVYMVVTNKLDMVNSLTISAYQLLFVIISLIIAKVRNK